MDDSTTDSNQKSQEIQRFSDLAESAALKAGNYLISQLGHVQVKEKNPGDFVTQADFESQRIIHDLIKSEFPGHGFLGEEGDQEQDLDRTDYIWIVDPIDGTTNFIHQLPSFSVSIALRYKGQMIVGCIHDPFLNETFLATRGGGAFLNGSPISSSKATQTAGSVVVCSLPRDLNRDSVELHRLIAVLCDSDATLRRLGSAALNLCYVAMGRIDSYWSTFAKIWDVAAGALILSEAGGVMTNLEGQEFDWNDIRFVASGTSQLNNEMIGLLSIKEPAN